MQTIEPNSIPQTAQMQAIVQHRYGSSDVLGLEHVDRPTAGPGQVLIEVHAAGLDRGTWHLMTGLPYLVRLAGFGLTKPKHPVLGLDVAGRVVGIGPNVDRFTIGDEVFGIADGSYAEFAIAEADKLSHKPANVSFEQAAAATISGITALQALTDIADVQPGQRVLVLGASGGVGTHAVQIAKALGAEVTGVASTAKTDLVNSLGADHVIDYTTDDFTAHRHHFDVILDIGGRNSLRRLRRALARKGTLVIVGGEDGNRITGGVGRQLRAVILSPFVGQRMTTFISTEHHSVIDRLAEFLQAGTVVPAVGARYDLADMPDAMRRMEAGRTEGKTVITVRPADGTGRVI
jgi:NADPH:quinone reductase-like Zn-dependent oxidoreductase